jgi:hypothetical protein
MLHVSDRAGSETFVTQSSEFRPMPVTWRVEKEAACNASLRWRSRSPFRLRW